MTEKKFNLLQGLSSEDLQRIVPLLRRKKLKKGDFLFFEGEPCLRIFFMQTGQAAVYRTNANARLQILHLLEPGDACACHSGCKSQNCSANAKAMSDCTVWYFSRNDFARIVKTLPGVSQALNDLLSERLQKYVALIDAVSLKSVRQRLAGFILDLRRQSICSGGDGLTLSLTFTREEIAQKIGAARESVARQIHNLRRENVLSLATGKIFIHNVSKLEQIFTAD